MRFQNFERSILSVAGAVIFLCSGVPARAAGDHLERLVDTDNARQPLRTARTRYQAEIDLRLSKDHARCVQGDAIVAGER